jgi:hypothetical protein
MKRGAFASSFSARRIFRTAVFNPVFAVDEDALAPDSLQDLVAGNELTATFHQQKQQFQRDAFEANDLASAGQAIGVRVEFEIREMTNPWRHFDSPNAP